MICEFQGENNYWTLNINDVKAFPKEDQVIIIVVGQTPQEPLSKIKKVQIWEYLLGRLTTAWRETVLTKQHWPLFRDSFWSEKPHSGWKTQKDVE